MKHLALCLTTAACLFAGGAARAQDPAPAPAPAASAAHGHAGARALEKKHHARDPHARDVEQGRKDPCMTLVSSKRDACLKRERARSQR